MKELFDRHQERLTDAEDRQVWGAMFDETRRRRPAWRRFRLPLSAAAAVTTVAAVAVVFTLTGRVGEQALLEHDAFAPSALNEPYEADAARLDDNAQQVEGEITNEDSKERRPAEARRQVPPAQPADVAVVEEEAPSLAARAEPLEVASPKSKRLAKAEVTAEPGTIRGRVKALDGTPLVYANVVILGTSMGAMTDTTGTFLVQNLPPGEHTVKVSYLGYEPVELTLEMNEGAGLTQDITLTEAQFAEGVPQFRDALRDRDREEKQAAGKPAGKDDKRLPVDSVEEAVGLTAGEVAALQTEGNLKIRGGRSGEEAYDISQVPVSDPQAKSQAEAEAPAVPLVEQIAGADAPQRLTTKYNAPSPRNQEKDNYGRPIAVGGTDPVNGKKFDAMFFEHYGVNPFVDPEDDRFATFAVDVDNASYTLARSYLNRGVLPPKDAIRVEEFVNSFDHDYPPPGSSLIASRDRGPSEHGTFAIHLEAAPSPFGKDLVLMRVGLKGREINLEDRKPAVLTFVVDVSGSMKQENRLELVKRALFLLLDQMNKEDEVGLVVYGSNARVLLPSTSLRHRRQIEQAIAALQPEGATNAEAGLREGYRLAERNYRKGWINRVILCSDGVANVGQTGADDILHVIKEQAGEGIALTTVGFGMGNYNDVLMEKLADKGDGNYYYVDDVTEARKVFVENLTGTLQTIAKQTKIQVEFETDAVRRYRLLGYENRDVADRDFRNDAIDAGEVGAGHEVTALFEVKLEKGARRGDLATVRIRYEDPESGQVTEEARTLRVQDVKRSLNQADPSFRMDAAVAEFSEILRHSYWAKDGSLATVSGMAREASRQLGSPEQLDEMCDLVETAWKLWPDDEPTTWNETIRPAWDPDDDDYRK